MVEASIRRLVLPELTILKNEQQVQREAFKVRNLGKGEVVISDSSAHQESLGESRTERGDMRRSGYLVDESSETSKREVPADTPIHSTTPSYSRVPLGIDKSPLPTSSFWSSRFFIPCVRKDIIALVIHAYLNGLILFNFHWNDSDSVPNGPFISPVSFETRDGDDSTCDQSFSPQNWFQIIRTVFQDLCEYFDPSNIPYGYFRNLESLVRPIYPLETHALVSRSLKPIGQNDHILVTQDNTGKECIKLFSEMAKKPPTRYEHVGYRKIRWDAGSITVLQGLEQYGESFCLASRRDREHVYASVRRTLTANNIWQLPKETVAIVEPKSRFATMCGAGDLRRQDEDDIYLAYGCKIDYFEDDDGYSHRDGLDRHWIISLVGSEQAVIDAVSYLKNRLPCHDGICP